jgi:hypothetical protein
VKVKLDQGADAVSVVESNMDRRVMRRIAIADGDAFGKIEGIVEASLARGGAFNG